MNDTEPATAMDARTPEGKAEIEQHVQCRLAGRLRDFYLLVADEGVVLRGRACTYHAKQLAQHLVMDLSGLPILANEIEVD